MDRLSRWGRSSVIIDTLDSDASENPYSRWLIGMLAAAIPMVVGVVTTLSKRAYFPGGRPLRIVAYGGKEAVALGIASMALGLLLHSHFFWSASYKYYFLAQILKPLSLLVLGVAMGFVVVNQLLFG